MTDQAARRRATRVRYDLGGAAPPVVALLAAAVLLWAAPGCSNRDDRPDAATWRASWEAVLDATPSRLPLEREDCDQLLVAARERRPELLPTPVQAVDTIVDEWLRTAQSLGFECGEHRDAQGTLDELRILAHEAETGLVDAGLGRTETT